jgi:hypothetical protein
MTMILLKDESTEPVNLSALDVKLSLLDGERDLSGGAGVECWVMP